MNLTAMRERMGALGRELEPLMKKEERSADDEARIDSILLEVNDLGPLIAREINAQGAADQARALTAEPNGSRHSGVTPVDGAERRERRETRSPIQRFMESDGYKRAMAGGTDRPVTRDQPVNVGSLHRGRGAFAFSEDRSIGPDEFRDLISSGTGSASLLLPDVFPGIYRGRERDLRMRDVLANATTTSDAITVLQESGFTNNAAEVAEATTVSGGAKPESAITFTEVTFPVRTLAHWIPITRQMLADVGMMEGYVEDRLRVGLERREDAEIINGNGTPPNLTGLLATSGIQNLDAAYYTGAPVINAGQPVENFNRILRAKSLIRNSAVGGAQATFVVLNPSDMEIFLTLGDANRQYYGPGPFSGGTIANLWGLSVVESENIAAGTALVGDGLMAAVVDRMDTTIYTTDSHSDFFTRNILVILAEERIALPVFRPAAFAKVALAA